ncbi:Circadian input kinase A [Richelia intracellularis]|nr:Circadian input kinase A [Richelia intracellularis]
MKQLQSLLNLRLSQVLRQKTGVFTEADIFQLVLEQLQLALKNYPFSNFHQRCLATALVQPKASCGSICHLVNSSQEELQDPWVGRISAEQNQLSLKLSTQITLKELQSLEQQFPQKAWRLPNTSITYSAWLIMDVTVSSCNEENYIISELMTNAAQQCAQALEQLQQILDLQNSCQSLQTFNQNLERTNQLKNQFLANTSHEIRTPLSSILGFTQLILAQGYEPSRERHQEYLNIILSSGKHLLALINDILDLSKIEADQLEVHWEKVNIPELCSNVLTLVKEKASNKGLKLQLKIDDNISILVADSLRLKQMLLNLLFNALKFTNNGSVGLKISLNGSFMNFTIWDTGIGIPKEQQKQLFQPYCQITNSTTNRQEGTGLGLVVTKKLAEMNGGWIELKSDTYKGSQFTISLPLVPNAALEQAPQLLTEVDEIGGDEHILETSVSLPPNSVDILLLEDDLDNAKVIQTFLENRNYRVTWVKSAREAWKVLTQINPAVILLDIQLPDSNGFELIKQLRQHEQYQDIPLIAQTAMAMQGDREACLSAGVNDYISKPLDLSKLARMIAKYMQ